MPKPITDEQIFDMLKTWRNQKVNSILSYTHAQHSENTTIANGWHCHLQSYNDRLFNWKITSPDIEDYFKGVVVFNNDVLIKLPTNIGGMTQRDLYLTADAHGQFQDFNWINVALKAGTTADELVQAVYDVYKTRLPGMGDYVHFGLIRHTHDVFYFEFWNDPGN